MEIALEIHKVLKETHVRNQIFGKLFQHLKDALLNKEEIEEIIEENDKVISEQQLQERASNNWVYQYAYTLIQKKAFTFGIILCIILNTIVLALDRYPSSDLYDQTLEKINIAFSFIFLTEMIIKLLGLGL